MEQFLGTRTIKLETSGHLIEQDSSNTNTRQTYCSISMTKRHSDDDQYNARARQFKSFLQVGIYVSIWNSLSSCCMKIWRTSLIQSEKGKASQTVVNSWSPKEEPRQHSTSTQYSRETAMKIQILSRGTKIKRKLKVPQRRMIWKHGRLGRSSCQILSDASSTTILPI